MPGAENSVNTEAYEHDSPALSLRGEIDVLTQQRSKELKNATYDSSRSKRVCNPAGSHFASWQNTSGYSKVQLESKEMEFRRSALNHGYSSFLQMSIIGLLWEFS
jgi:hypothetical protein